ncbi:hypothetical protein G6011_06389 [Alternaria panax]|uniref:Uncharacterized protein n=1 Tax=Alternaria panax TaxID=48097 RepID=A0AAD4I9C6_9PLEO|nr:hypothetical protein G6011_06389 [Alternaria panax]
MFQTVCRSSDVIEGTRNEQDDQVPSDEEETAKSHASPERSHVFPRAQSTIQEISKLNQTSGITISLLVLQICQDPVLSVFVSAKQHERDPINYPGFENDYEYAPRSDTNPMTSPKTLAVCLKACDMNCKWPWPNPWHNWVSLACRSHKLLCIPKKKRDFDMQSDDALDVAWVLEADHAISVAFMEVHHLAPLLAAFDFRVYWLIKSPGHW